MCRQTHPDQIGFSALFIFDDNEKLVRLRIDERHLCRAICELTRLLKIVLFQRDRGQIDDRKRLIRFLFQCGVQMERRVFQFSFG